MKSIKVKIIAVVVCMVVVASAVIGGISCFLNYTTTKNALEKSLQVTAQVASEDIANKIGIVESVAEETGCNSILGDAAVSLSDKQSFAENKCKAKGYSTYKLLDANGKDEASGESCANTTYYKSAVKGTTCIDGPLLNQKSGEYYLIAAAPVWENGITNSKVVGVICFEPKLLDLSDLVSQIKVGESGYAYMLDANGNTMAHNNKDLVMKVNSTELAKTDKSYTAMAKVESQMLKGNTGVGYYKYGKDEWCQAYAPIASSNGWSVGVFIKEREFLNGVYLSIGLTILCAVIAIAAGTVIAFIVSRRIANPILKCVERLRLLVKGDLHSPVPEIHSKDETGVLAECTSELVGELSGIIQDISGVLDKISGKNLNITHLNKYPGDFEPIYTSFKSIIDSLNSMITEISESASQVSAGSQQVSDSAQALSQGSTEQSSSTEELAATANEIMHKVDENAENAKAASESVQKAVEEIDFNNQQMSDMLAAMTEINAKSSEIGHIIKTIDSIAFQTNILALNAAVEAARAGEAGKGFSVVADEVRNLANKSAQAAKSTTVLIDDTVAAVGNGEKLANEAAQTMQSIVERTNEVKSLIEKIAFASQNQAVSIDQMTQGVDQISAVVQTNSATSEESAAASEELYSQAQSLKDMVGEFQLKNADSGNLSSVSK